VVFSTKTGIFDVMKIFLTSWHDVICLSHGRHLYNIEKYRVPVRIQIIPDEFVIHLLFCLIRLSDLGLPVLNIVAHNTR
jgi:hypothetical protein